jgi:predicted metalloprotease
MPRRSVRPAIRRTVIVAAVVPLIAVGLGACTMTVTGSALPGEGVPMDVSPDAFPITGATDNEIDRLVRDALVDINTFWGETFPQLYGQDFPPVGGGYFSVDSTGIDAGAYPDTGIGCPEQPVDPAEVAGNAFYNRRCDAVAYDRALLSELSHDYGRVLPAVVLAHEFGHVIQGRVGFAASGRSIQDETQADCFAGAWTGWVVAGNAAHVAIRAPELDDVLRGYLLLRDPVGSDPENRQAHGSYFDRISAFSSGYDDGATACRDDFGEDRLFTAATFDQDDQAGQGNSPYDTTLEVVGQTLPAFWNSTFPAAFGMPFTAPRIAAFQGTAPSCGAMGSQDRDLGYCASDGTVYYDETDLVRPAYQDLGDFAVATAISLPYALAVRAQAGLSTDDGRATRSAVCLTGWYEAQIFNGAFSGVRLSPGDVDEAVEFLLAYGVSESVFPDVDASGFELLQAFRTGFLEGGTGCDVGL